MAQLLTDNLDTVAPDLAAGAVVVLADTDVRIRHLPIPPGH